MQRLEDKTLPTLALSMIVKNAERDLPSCLSSVSGLVDQIVIADTGSTDQTCEIARAFGATIVQSPWTNHFADARNASLAAVSTDWVLVLDADEEVSIEAREHLPSLLDSADHGGYQVEIREYLPAKIRTLWPIDLLPNTTAVKRAAEAPVYMKNKLCRLFRRREDIFFTGRVHELVQPQIEKTGLLLGQAPFFIDHFGHMGTQRARDGKSGFYRELLAQRLREEPNNALVWTYNGMSALDMDGNPREALRLLENAVRIEPNLLEAWIVAAKALCALERWQDALTVLETVRSGNQFGYIESTLRGNACFALGRREEARAAYAEALRYDPGDTVAQAKLSYLEMRLGDAGEAEEGLKKAATALPGLVHTLLVDGHIHAGRIDQAAEECERWCVEHKDEQSLLQAAQLQSQLRRWARVEALTVECLQAYPQSVTAYELLLLSSVAGGKLPAAAAIADVLTQLTGEPGSFLRAAALHAKAGNAGESRRALERGLELYPEARELLDAMAQEQKSPEDACASFAPAG